MVNNPERPVLQPWMWVDLMPYPGLKARYREHNAAIAYALRLEKRLAEAEAARDDLTAHVARLVGSAAILLQQLDEHAPASYGEGDLAEALALTPDALRELVAVRREVWQEVADRVKEAFGAINQRELLIDHLDAIEQLAHEALAGDKS